MVDAADSEFEGTLAALKGPWNKIERECKRVIPGKSSEAEFYFWFVSKKRDIVHNNMLKAVRVAAQLGNPTEKFYINASELTNVLKLKVDRKPQSCPVFIDHVQELASAQEKNIERVSFLNQKSLVKKVIEASCMQPLRTSCFA